MAGQHRIENPDDLQAVIGEPLEFMPAKVVPALDDAMRGFIGAAPLLFVSTVGGNGRIDVSPKGDPAGFVHIDDKGDLLIPERPGNRLAFGFHNILENPQVGLIFVVPGTRETLRVKGRATLHTDPEVLGAMQVSGKPALLYTRVAVEECFFHCGKAMIRSKLWQPDSWQAQTGSPIARQLSVAFTGDEGMAAEVESELEKNYVEELY